MTKNVNPITQPKRVVDEAKAIVWKNPATADVVTRLIQEFEEAEAQFIEDDGLSIPNRMDEVTVHLMFLLAREEVYVAGDKTVEVAADNPEYLVRLMGGARTVQRLGKRVQELELWLDEGMPWVYKDAVKRAKAAEKALAKLQGKL